VLYHFPLGAVATFSPITPALRRLGIPPLDWFFFPTLSHPLFFSEPAPAEFFFFLAGVERLDPIQVCPALYELVSPSGQSSLGWTKPARHCPPPPLESCCRALALAHCILLSSTLPMSFWTLIGLRLHFPRVPCPVPRCPVDHLPLLSVPGCNSYHFRFAGVSPPFAIILLFHQLCLCSDLFLMNFSPLLRARTLSSQGTTNCSRAFCSF